MRIAAYVAIILLLAGCGAPVTEPTQPDEGPRSSSDKLGPVRVRLHEGERNLTLGSSPEDGSFDVPAGVKSLHVTFLANRTDSCSLAHGPASTNPAEPFPEGWVEFISPSGGSHSSEKVLLTGCDPAFSTEYRSETDFDAEEGSWTVRYEWTGYGFAIKVLVDAEGVTATE